MQPCPQNLVPSPLNKSILTNTQWQRSTNSFTIQPLIHMPSSHITPATWSLWSTVTHNIFQNRNLRVERSDIFHVQKYRHSTQQRSRHDHHPNHQGRHFLYRRGQTYRPLHQLPRGHYRPAYSWRKEHKQPPTPIQNDNTMVHGVVTNNISRKSLISMEMRFHCDRVQASLSNKSSVLLY